MNLKNYSLVPNDLLDKDPRNLAYYMPESVRATNISFISFLKRMQRFSFYQNISYFEEFAHANNMILLPASVLHWRRREKLGDSRRFRIGRSAFYLVRVDELTEGEKKKLLDHIEVVREGVI